MASKKKKTESLSLGLALPASGTGATNPTGPPSLTDGKERQAESVQAVDLESFDDYDDSVSHEDVPKLRLVDPPKLVGVIVEATDKGYWVSKITHNGTCWSQSYWSKSELLELINRAQSALEV